MPKQSRAEVALTRELNELETRRQALKAELAAVESAIAVVERVMGKAGE